jgi:transcriptional regulator with XRE-family HTH domain
MGNTSTFTARTFGQNLRRLRKARGYSQEGFAHDSGIDRSYFGGVERGDRNPSLTMILSIANALDVPPAILFETDKERFEAAINRMRTHRGAE